MICEECGQKIEYTSDAVDDMEKSQQCLSCYQWSVYHDWEEEE